METVRIPIRDPFEADIYIDILKTENIPYALIPNESLPYNGIFEMTMGWGVVDVPKEYEALAVELLTALRDTYED